MTAVAVDGETLAIQVPLRDHQALFPLAEHDSVDTGTNSAKIGLLTFQFSGKNRVFTLRANKRGV